MKPRIVKKISGAVEESTFFRPKGGTIPEALPGTDAEKICMNMQKKAVKLNILADRALYAVFRLC
jgi:hypothetical protein